MERSLPSRSRQGNNQPLNKMKYTTNLRPALIPLFAVFSSSAAFAESGKLGKMGPDEFKGSNDVAAEKVKAVKAGEGALSESDAELLKKIAKGGMIQLEISKVAVAQASSEDVKMIAKAEVAEQELIGAKVKEIAAAGSVTLPTGLDDDEREMVDELKKETGLELDKKYLKDSGVTGHEMLKKTMEEVRDDAESSTLKALANATLPIINTHLKVATDEAADMD